MKQSGKSKPIKDSYNRQIDYLRISITDKCNLKCVYCSPKKGLEHFKESEMMSDEEIIRFIRIAHKLGLRKVRLTGGEPLLRKNILKLISSIKETGIEDLSLTTNGILLYRMAEELKRAGLTRVNISLDTMNPERYRSITRGGDFASVWDSIHESEKLGFSPVKINFVPVRGLNDDEIVKFASLTLKKNYHIRFIEFMPATHKRVWSKDKLVSGAEILKKVSAIGSLEQLDYRGRGPSRNYRIKGAAGVLGIISPISDHFCNSCNRLRLTAVGKIRPCLFSKEEIDIKTPMREGASDAEIEKIYLKAIKTKPEGHKLNTDTSSQSAIDTMSKIGG